MIYWNDMNSVKSEIVKAVKLVIIVSIIAFAVDLVRSPFLDFAAQNAFISQFKAYRGRGVDLFRTYTPPQTVITDNWHDNHPVKNDPRITAINEITSDMAREMFDAGNCVFIDARSSEEYAQGHIPGAYSWPIAKFDEYLGDFKEKIPVDRCVVVYCSSRTCDESGDLSNVMIREGWKNLSRFTGGMEEWNWGSNPVKEGNQP